MSVELENIETGNQGMLNVQDGTFSEVKTNNAVTKNDRLCLALYIKQILPLR